nr:flagellar hook-length control protein FliK [Lachnospiraceae bacterium]
MSLKLLTQNQNASPTILKALGSAGFDVTDRAIEMVKSMMDKNLPLDPDTVGSMVKNAVFFEGESTDTLATLKKLGVSVNDMNIEQLKAYDNGEGKLETPLYNIAKDLPEVIAKSDDARTALQVARTLTEGVNELKQDITSSTTPVIKAEEFVETPADGVTAPKVNIDKLITVIDREMTEIIKGELSGENRVNEPGPGFAGKVSETVDGDKQQVVQSLQTETVNEEINHDEGITARFIGDAKPILNPDLMSQDNRDVIVNEGAADIENASVNSGNIQQGLTGSIDFPVQEANDKVYTRLLNDLVNILKGNDVPEAMVKELFKSAPVKELLAKTMQEQWFMNPDKMEDKEEVDKFYNKMNRQLTRIQEALTGNKSVPAELTRNIADIKNNLSFINEANHLYQYVQIPIKMASEHATGDLYVYTNKKNLRDPKQEITAHLHLEMEHLGTTDVDIVLRQKKLSTHFMLADEKSLDLVLEHIDMLTQRLNDKGFEVNIDASKMQDENDGDFLSKIMGMPLPKINYSKQSFDVKV